MEHAVMLELNDDNVVELEGKDYAIVPFQEMKQYEPSIAESIGMLALTAYVAFKAISMPFGFASVAMCIFCLCMLTIFGKNTFKAIDNKIKSKKD